MDERITEGMAEVAEGLAKYASKKGYKKQSDELMKRAKIFKNLNKPIKGGNVKMGKRLTPREKEDRVVERLVKRIITIEKQYGIEYTRRACFRYYSRRGDELRLKREISEKEEELKGMKNKIKNK